MAFLASAMGQVLGLVDAERTESLKCQNRLVREASDEAAKRKTEEEADRRFQEAEAAFLRAFPTVESQQEAVTAIGARIPFVRSQDVLRRLAITEWASASHQG
jgi:hypothetical protein